MIGELSRVVLLSVLILAFALPTVVVAQDSEEAAQEGAAQEPMVHMKAPASDSSDRHYVYQLNHISTANALSILKTVGYPVIEASTASMVQEVGRPVVIDLPDSETTSLVTGTSVQLEGGELKGIPAGVPQQRLLIVWDADDPRGLERLLGLLYEQIDVPARQILIEALILELDRNRFKDLGISFAGSQDGQTFDFASGALTPFSFIFQRPRVDAPLNLTVTLEALVRDGTAKVLSQPSVLVLDGRQARIHVGDKVPYTEVLSSKLDTTDQVVSSTSWADVGISLNLRPRATEDGSEVTMQVETLISNSETTQTLTNAVLGPPISTREVQTIVRVANDTPFVIGGLISKSESDQRSGIPYLSKIPGLGKLFRKRNRARQQKEVIVVITPHVIPLEDRAFSYSIAKDTDLLDKSDLTLFRDVYRVRSDDVFDLNFILRSDLYRSLRQASERKAEQFGRLAVEAGWEPVAPGDRAALARQMHRALREKPDFLNRMPELDVAGPLLGLFEGRVPGEEILVQRMLLGIVEKLDYGRHIDPEKIIFFEAEAEGAMGQPILEVSRLFPKARDLGKDCRTLRLVFVARPPGSKIQDLELNFDPPTAVVDSKILADDAAYLSELRRLNKQDVGARRQLGVLLNECYQRRDQSTMQILRNVLALKRVLEVNPSLPLTLEGFHAGREVVFPASDSLKAANHVVDRHTAALFYDTLDYYYAFEQAFGVIYKAIQAHVPELVN